MDTKNLATAIIAFMLGGLVVSIAAELEDDGDTMKHGSSVVRIVAQ